MPPSRVLTKLTKAPSWGSDPPFVSFVSTGMMGISKIEPPWRGPAPATPTPTLRPSGARGHPGKGRPRCANALTSPREGTMMGVVLTNPIVEGPMFIRSKVVKGFTYYFVVEGRRVEGKVRQRTLVSLGRHATLPEALEAARRELTHRRRERSKLAIPNPPKAIANRLAVIDRRMAVLTERIEIMRTLRKSKLLGTREG
jgi:hypothetical protein